MILAGKVPEAVNLIGGKCKYAIPENTPWPKVRAAWTDRKVLIPEGFCVIKEWALSHGKSDQCGYHMVKTGRVEGVRKLGGMYIIPINAPYPARRHKNKIIKKSDIAKMRENLGLETA